jgi:putative ABC transport system permease protein
VSFFKQAFTVILLGLYTIPQRLSSAGVAIVGIAGVVVVLVGVLSIAEGFEKAMVNAGRPDRAIVMRQGADSELSSGIGGPEVDIIKQAAGVRKDGAVPTASAEMFVVVDVNRKTTNTGSNVPLRGVDSTLLAVRPEVKIVEGRMLTFGTNEVVVGRAASQQFAGLRVGDTFRSGQTQWPVVGVFDTAGTAAETEIWCDVRTLQGAFRRGNSYQSVLARLESPASFDAFKDWLSSNPQVDVDVKRESDYYREQSRGLTTLVQGIGWGVAILMGLGAIIGAVLTMYSAVVARTREIATLRALGFGSFPVLLSILGESMVLALVGGVIGGALAYIGFNGFQTSTMNWQTFSQVAFGFAVTPALLMQGMLYALIMGLLGGIFPAIRAARLPISRALREL